MPIEMWLVVVVISDFSLIEIQSNQTFDAEIVVLVNLTNFHDYIIPNMQKSYD